MPHRIQAPDGTTIEFPDTMQDADIESAMGKLYPAPVAAKVNAAIASVPRPFPTLDKKTGTLQSTVPNPIATAPEEAGLETGPILSPHPEENTSKMADWDPAGRTFAREINAVPKGIYDATVGAVGGAAKALTTPPQNIREATVAGAYTPVPVPPQLKVAADRLLVQPVENAISDYASGKVTPEAALNVAPEAIGNAAGQMVAAKGIETAKVPEPLASYVREKVPSRWLNSAIKPSPDTFNYGRDPGRAVLEEGVVAGSRNGMLDQIAAKRDAAGAQIATHLADPKINKPVVDITKSVTGPLDEYEAAAIKGKNLKLADQIADLRERLLNDYARDTSGKLVPTGPAKLSGLTPAEANSIKQDIGKMAKWTGTESDLLSPGLREIYGRINTQIENSAPGIKQINKKYAELSDAHDALDHTIRLGQKYNPYGSLTDILAGLKWGPAGYLASKVGRSVPGQTLGAQIMHRSEVPQPIQNAAAVGSLVPKKDSDARH